MKKKILLVDDSKVALMTQQMLLRNTAGYEVLVASDGDEAVSIAIAEQPDLILMDVVMPTMNGLEACRVLRSQPKTEGIPIILVTTRGESKSVEAGFKSGCTDYVTKPVNAVELLRKIADLIE